MSHAAATSFFLWGHDILYDKKFKFLKKLLISCLCMLLVFNFYLKPKKADAVPIAPLLWVAGAVVGDIAAELGWKYVAKPAYQAIKDKIGKQIVAKADNFDFTKKPIKKKKDGTLVPQLTPADKAKIATLLAIEADNVIDVSKKRKSKTTEYIGEANFADVDPLYSTGVKVNFAPAAEYENHKRMFDFFRKMFSVEFKPNAYAMSTKVTIIDELTGKSSSFDLLGGQPYKQYTLLVGPYVLDYGMFTFTYLQNDGTYKNVTTDNFVKAMNFFKLWEEDLENKNRTVYLADGLIVPEDNSRVYRYPVDLPGTYILPNFDDIDTEIVIGKDVETDVDIDIDWDDLEAKIDLIEQKTLEIENELDITNKDYQYTLNQVNYYYDYDYDKTKEEVDEEIGVIIVNPPSTGGGGTGPPAEIPSNFFDLMSEMGGKIIDMYNGVTQFLEDGVQGMKSLADGTVGLVDFLDDFFSWLPSEYRTLFGSAFMLGVVAFFMRR